MKKLFSNAYGILKAIAILLALSAISLLLNMWAQAADIKNAEYKQFFLSNGKNVSAQQAILDSLRNESDVFKCTSVVAMPSKSGTSIGLKNVKKPHLAKN